MNYNKYFSFSLIESKEANAAVPFNVPLTIKCISGILSVLEMNIIIAKIKKEKNIFNFVIF